MEPLRDIIESEEYTRLCGELSPDMQRLDEQLRGVTWSIGRRPEAFTRIVANLYVVETFAPVGEDYLFVFYTIDGPSTCTLRWIAAGDKVVPVEETTFIDLP
jgi:hypothetical protein